MEYPVDGEILVTRHILGVQIKEDEEQTKNTFHTKCHVNEKVCSLTIDGEVTLM